MVAHKLKNKSGLSFALLWASLFFLVSLSNRYYTFTESFNLGQYDVQNFWILSQTSASEWKDQYFPHAQRFFLPWVLGVLSRTTGISCELIFSLAAFFMLAGWVVLLVRIFESLKISKSTRLISMFLIVFNPYFFRFYLAFPGMLTEAGFILGVALVILGLMEGKAFPLFAGAALTALTRQLGLIMVAPIFLCVLKGEGWKNFTRIKKAWVLSFAGFELVGLYVLTAYVAGGNPWGLENFNVVGIGLSDWKGNHFAYGELCKFFVKGALALLFPILVFLPLLAKSQRLKKLPPDFYLFVFLFFSLSMEIWMLALSYPYHSPARYMMHGFIPFMVLWALLAEALGFADEKLNRKHAVLCATIFFGSFHHQTSLLSFFGWSNVQFGLWSLFFGGTALWASFGILSDVQK